MLTRDDLKAIKELIESGNNALLLRLDKQLDKELAPLKREIHIMKKEVDEMAEEFGNNDVYLRRRMRKIEDHLEHKSRKT